MLERFPRRIRQHCGALAAVALAFVSADAAGAPIQAVTFGASSAFPSGTNGAPTVVTSLTGELLPDTNWAHPTQPLSTRLFAGGFANANALGVYADVNVGFSYTSAIIRDDYVISGPDGPVEITLNLTGEATFTAQEQLNSGIISGTGNFNIYIGTGVSSDGRNVSGIQAQDNLLLLSIQDTNPRSVELETSYTTTVQANENFTFSYGFVVNGSGGYLAEGLNTAAIGIDLPEGYTITSSLGYVVPEPSSLALAGIGLVSGLLLARGHRGR